ncbi:MAG: putative holin-like toxin [Roseburia sp.]
MSYYETMSLLFAFGMFLLALINYLDRTRKR